MKMRRVNSNILEICNEKNEVILSLAEELVDKTLQVKLCGMISNDVAVELEDEIMAALSACCCIQLDFEEVTYLAGAALKSLLSIQQIIDEMDSAQMKLVRVPPMVLEVFKEAGFDEILWIENELG